MYLHQILGNTLLVIWSNNSTREKFIIIADIMRSTFTALRIPNLPFLDDGASGRKTLKRSGRAIQDLLEAFATLTFPASERLVAATILQQSLDNYLCRLGKPKVVDVNKTPAVYRELIEAFQDAGTCGHLCGIKPGIRK